MRSVLVLALIAVASSAHADNKELRHPPCVCAPPPSAKPTLLLEVRWHEDGMKVVSKLFSTGMWTRAFTGFDGTTSTTGGRLDSATLDDVKAGLKAARWKVTRAKARCQETSDEATEFYVAGHKRFTAKTCGDAGGDHLDTVDVTSQKLIDLLGQRLELVGHLEMDEEISVATP